MMTQFWKDERGRASLRSDSGRRAVRGLGVGRMRRRGGDVYRNHGAREFDLAPSLVRPSGRWKVDAIFALVAIGQEA